MHISISPTDFSDWPALLTLLREAFAFMEGRIDPPSSLDHMSAADLQAKAGQETLILAREREVLLGCAFAAQRADCLYVGKVAVAAAARRRGVARALFDAAEMLARQQRRDWLELQTRVELLENHATFAALGFHKVAETAHPGYARPTSITLRKPVAPHTP
jgi:GNAT superfamily N-acetyltransferase